MAAISAGASYYLDIRGLTYCYVDDVYISRARCRCNALFRNIFVKVVILHDPYRGLLKEDKMPNLKVQRL